MIGFPDQPYAVKSYDVQHNNGVISLGLQLANADEAKYNALVKLGCVVIYDANWDVVYNAFGTLETHIIRATETQ